MCWHFSHKANYRDSTEKHKKKKEIKKDIFSKNSINNIIMKKTVLFVPEIH
jgi:hypothetical protein